MSPFFIVGCGRSGTTLLRRILVSHPDVAIPPESLFLIDYLRVSGKFKIEQLIKMLVREPEIREWGIEPEVTDFANCKTIPAALDRLHQLYAFNKAKGLWGQKTPRLIRDLDIIKSNFPDALFIHIVRDPRAVANSLIRSNVHHSNAYYAATRWLRDVSKGVEFESKYSEKVLRISYEGLVTEPETTIRQIANFLGISFVEEMLVVRDETILKEYSTFYSSIHANIGQALTPEFANQWQEQLSRKEIQIIESVCSPFMQELGYKCIFAEQPSPRTFWPMRVNRIAGLFRQMYQYLRHRPQYAFYVTWRKLRFGLLLDFLRDVNQ